MSLGAEVVGISTDDRKVQCDFAAHVKAPYPMIPDPEGAIARQFDVLWPFIRLVRRVTFVIDGAGYVRGVFQHEIWVRQHIDDAVAAVKRLAGQQPEAGADA